MTETDSFLSLVEDDDAAGLSLVEDDDAAGDESHQAKRQAVDFSNQLALNLPPDVFAKVMINLDPQSIKHTLSTCKTARAQGSNEFWQGLCKVHYPRVHHMLAFMPTPDASWRQIYFNQVRAERPLRFPAVGVMPPLTTTINDYVYSVEIYGAQIGGVFLEKTLLSANAGRLGECTDDLGIAIKLWDEAKEPSWPVWRQIVTDFRAKGDGWYDSDGYRVASALQVTIFIMRPRDGASFCLYDGFVTRDGYENPMLEIVNNFNAPTTESDDEDGDDTFYLNFAEMALPLAGAAALDIHSRGLHSTGAWVDSTLHLRSKGLHSDVKDPLYDPAKSNGNLAGDGELHLRFWAAGANRARGEPYVLNHDAIVRYFESFAPFS